MCRAISCSDPACALCKNSVDRRCPDNDFFEDKYVRGRDAIGSKCGGPIQITLTEVASGLPCEIDVDLRVIVVNGHLFDREFGVLDGHVRVEHVYEKMHIFANQVSFMLLGHLHLCSISLIRCHSQILCSRSHPKNLVCYFCSAGFT